MLKTKKYASFLTTFVNSTTRCEIHIKLAFNKDKVSPVLYGNRGSRFFIMLIILMLSTLVLGISAAAQIESVYPSDDAYIRAGTYTTVNYGSADTLDLKNSATVSNDRDVLLRFNLSSVSTSVTGAVLKLCNTSTYSCSMDIYTTSTTSWSEGTVTWSNAPQKVTKLTTVTVPSNAEVVVDVTSYISSVMSGTKIASLRLTNDSQAEKTLAFNSKESGASASVLVLGSFSHPGILENSADLTRICTYANLSNNPIKTGYNKLVESEFSTLTYQYQAYENVAVSEAGNTVQEDHFRNDAHSAYALALRWIKTGDNAYRDRSIAIMNSWANTFDTISCDDYEYQPALEAAWAVPLWVTAAETIRYYGNGSTAWGSAGIAQFKVFVGKMMGYVNGMGDGFNPNWTASRALSQMSAGVFLDDVSLYSTGYNEMASHIALIGADGKPSENDRDCVHAQYNVIATSQGAQIADNQGNSALYLQKRLGEAADVAPLLLRQSEYFVRQLMGDVPTGGHDYSTEAKRNPPYEMLLARYKYDFSMQIPYTESFVLNYNRPVDCSEPHFTAWTTVTHAKW